MQPECGICLLPMEFQETHKKLDCQHSFHTDCIMRWFQYKVNCPLCRKKGQDHLEENCTEDQEEDIENENENVLTLNVFIRSFYAVEFCFFTSLFIIWITLILTVFISTVFKILTSPSQAPTTAFINKTLLPFNHSSACYALH
jgi:hypothetical protein